jgi:hypothetical protein
MGSSWSCRTPRNTWGKAVAALESPTHTMLLGCGVFQVAILS